MIVSVVRLIEMTQSCGGLRGRMRSRNAKNLFGDDLSKNQQAQIPVEGEDEPPTTTRNKRSLSVLFCGDDGAITGAKDIEILSLTSKGKEKARSLDHAKIIPDVSRQEMLRRIKARIQSRVDINRTCAEDDEMRDAVNKLVQPVAEFCEDRFFRDAIAVDASIALVTYLSEATLDVRLHDAAVCLKRIPQQPCAFTSAAVAAASATMNRVRSPVELPPLLPVEQHHPHQAHLIFSPLTASPAATALTILAKPQSSSNNGIGTQSSGVQDCLATTLITPDHGSPHFHPRNVGTGHGYNNSNISSTSSSSHVEEILAAAAEKWDVLVNDIAAETSMVPIGEAAAAAADTGTMIDDGGKQGGK